MLEFSKHSSNPFDLPSSDERNNEMVRAARDHHALEGPSSDPIAGYDVEGSQTITVQRTRQIHEEWMDDDDDRHVHLALDRYLDQLIAHRNFRQRAMCSRTEMSLIEIRKARTLSLSLSGSHVPSCGERTTRIHPDLDALQRIPCWR